MPTLSSSELAAMRAEQAATLPDTCTIQTATSTSTKGSVATSYANTYTSVPCRVAGVGSATERELGMAPTSIVTHVLTVGHAQELNASDRVIHAGVTYEVVAPVGKDASWRTARRAWLKRVGA